MKIGDLLNTLAGKINQQNNQALIDVLSRQDMQQVDIPDELANLLAADLMSLEGAKNNASIKSHFTALALNGVDKELGNAVSELGIEDDIFKAEKDTYGKVRTLSAKIKELVEKKGLHQPNVQRVISGRYSVGVDVLAKIARALHCRLDLVEELP